MLTLIAFAAYLLKKFGSEARIRRVFGAIADTGLTVEIPFNFEGIDHTPNTVNVHRFIARFADDRTILGVSEALFRAYFIEGRNIGEMDVLADLGADLGIPRKDVTDFIKSDDGTEEVYEENARAHRIGINGVPAFVFNEQFVISGAQEPEVLARVLDAANMAGRKL